MNLPIERQRTEKLTAEVMAAEHLNKDEFAIWKGYRAIYRELVWQGRKFKLYNGKKEFAVFEFCDMDCSFDKGFELKLRWLTGELAGQTEWIDQTPANIGGWGVFAWVPYMLDVRYLDNAKGSERSLSMPVAFKSKHSATYLNDHDVFISVVE